MAEWQRAGWLVDKEAKRKQNKQKDTKKYRKGKKEGMTQTETDDD